MQVIAAKNFRENLRVAMKNEGISQRDMGKLCGVSYPFVNRVLTGKAVPDLDMCDTFAKSVGYSTDVMLLAPKEFRRRFSRELMAS